MADCLFCRIKRKEIPAKFEYEDEEIFSIYDAHPQAPFHLLIIPTLHLEKISDLTASHAALMGRLIYQAKQIADQNRWKDYRLIFNNGQEAGQSVFHIHLHLLSGRRMSWPPG
ncbi:MAG: histidine triad nucleotide-binding protein [Candidatus Omnitrophica bacterium]|nr:histidine triad nucleotide-binding protein [Candidatus Omnitrophota bacterium]